MGGVWLKEIRLSTSYPALLAPPASAPPSPDPLGSEPPYPAHPASVSASPAPPAHYPSCNQNLVSTPITPADKQLRI